MKSFLNTDTLAAARKKEKRFSVLLRLLAVAMLAAAAAELLLTRTGNAARMLRILYATLLLFGLFGMICYVLFLRPARRWLAHLEGLQGREPEVLEGRFTLTDDSFRIPGSVPVRSVLLDTGGETLRLNLDVEWAPLAPPDGTQVRLQTVGKFITGIQPAEETGPRTDVSRPSLLRRFLRGAGAVVPAFILWAMLVLVVGGFVFNQATDAPRGSKIVLFVDTELRDAPELAEALEKNLPAPIRMVKVHPFSYALMGSDTLRQADLYIVPASHAEEYREWFAPLPAAYASLAAPEEPDGIPVYDPATGLSAAGDRILYESAPEAPETCYLFFGGGSVHLQDGLAGKAAEALLSLKPEKEETP
jgi:hypothetical protein